jgi:ABC-type dipeptide/oligopeptide/nickel transport system ATPase component
MIAVALACDPAMLIADEPTTALDVTIQAQILSLLAELKREQGMAMVLVTHDMGLARAISSRVLFLHQGLIEEEAPPETLFTAPKSARVAQFLKASSGG